MIRFGKQIRLTKREVERFTQITGVVPENVKSLDDFESYIARCQRRFPGQSRDARFLRWLIDRERSRSLGLCA